MAAFGMMEILILVLLGSGNPIEVVSALDAPAYFKSRDIEVSTAKLLALAGAEPKTGKDQIAQLLAIRALSQGADKNKAEVQALLKAIAAGEKANDPQGFAKDHAEQALAAIAGKPTGRLVPRNSVRGEAIRWFPAECSFFGVLDARHAEGFEPILSGDALRARLKTYIPAMVWPQIYDYADKAGNVRLDRIAFAYQADADERGKDRLFFRFTGKAEPKRLIALIKELAPTRQFAEKEGEGTTVYVSSAPGEPPAYAIIGDADLIVAGFNKNELDHLSVLEEVLKTRKAAKSAVNTFAQRLRDVPADASVLIMGNVVGGLKDSFERSPLPATPKSVSAYAVMGKTLKLNVAAELPDADSAKGSAMVVDELKQNTLQLIKVAGLKFKLPVDAVKGMTAAANSIKHKVDDTRVDASVEFSSAAVKGIGDLVQKYFMMAIPPQRN